jgi:hypothetical protein
MPLLALAVDGPASAFFERSDMVAILESPVDGIFLLTEAVGADI